MCYSAEASIISFTAGMIGSLLCISLGSNTDKMIGYFFAFVSLMQGVDYLLWTHQKCDDYNRIVSIIGMILNHLQPIVAALLVFYYNSKNKYNKYIFMTIIIYLLVIVPYSLQFLQNNNHQYHYFLTLLKHNLIP